MIQLISLELLVHVGYCGTQLVELLVEAVRL